MIIGIISDTHGFVHRAIFDAFRDVDAIVHAGDVGELGVIEQLKTIAPTYAVRGNIHSTRFYINRSTACA